LLDVRGDLLVQGEELGEQIFLWVEAVGREDGGVERGVCVIERICAGLFERAIERTQAAFPLRQGLSAHAAHLARGCCHGINLRDGAGR
jgi:hypothetical protein